MGLWWMTLTSVSYLPDQQTLLSVYQESKHNAQPHRMLNPCYLWMLYTKKSIILYSKTLQILQLNLCMS